MNILAHDIDHHKLRWEMLICDDETGHGSSACLAFCFSFVHFLGPTIMVIMIITTCHIILVTSVTKDDNAAFVWSHVSAQISNLFCFVIFHYFWHHCPCHRYLDCHHHHPRPFQILNCFIFPRIHPTPTGVNNQFAFYKTYKNMKLNLNFDACYTTW